MKTNGEDLFIITKTKLRHKVEIMVCCEVVVRGVTVWKWEDAQVCEKWGKLLWGAVSQLLSKHGKQL